MKIVRYILGLITILAYAYEVNSNRSRSRHTLRNKNHIFESLDKYKTKKTDNKKEETHDKSKPAKGETNLSDNARFKSTSKANTAKTAVTSKNLSQSKSKATTNTQAQSKSSSKAKQFPGGISDINSISQGSSLNSQYNAINTMNPNHLKDKKLGIEPMYLEAWIKYYTFTNLSDAQLMALENKKIPLYANNLFYDQAKQDPNVDLQRKHGSTFVNIPDNSSFYLTIFGRVVSISQSRVVSLYYFYYIRIETLQYMIHSQSIICKILSKNLDLTEDLFTLEN